MTSLLLACIAINQAGSTEPAAIQEALRNLDVDTNMLPIPWGGYEMDEYGQNQAANSFIVQMRDGKYQTVYPADSAVIDAVVPMPAWNER